MLFLLPHLLGCVPADPLDDITGPAGTQAGDEGDERRCDTIEVAIDGDDVLHGNLDMTPAAFLEVVETPVSGSASLPDGTEPLELVLTALGPVRYAYDTPRPEFPDEACGSEVYRVEVDARLTAGSQLDLAWTTDADGIQAGNARVGIELPLEEVVGTLAPQTLVAGDWNEVVLRAFGGSTDGVWAFNMDWRAQGDGPSSEEEDIGRFTLSP